MKWWISRSHHDDVVRGKDETIRALRDHIDALEKRLDQPIKVTVEMPSGSLPAAPSNPEPKDETPAAGRTRKAKPLREFDYATLDEKDPVQMAALAMEEFGSIPPPQILARWYNIVRMQCVYGRKKRIAQAEQTGRVGTIEVDNAVASEEPAPKTPAPQEILDVIAAAERGA